MTHVVQLQPGWRLSRQHVSNFQCVFVEDLTIGECVTGLAVFFDGFFSYAADHVVCENVHILPLHAHPQYHRRRTKQADYYQQVQIVFNHAHAPHPFFFAAIQKSKRVTAHA